MTEDVSDQSEEGGSPVVEPLDPEAAFDLLGQEIRLSIVRELGAAEKSLAFSELYERTDVDDTGQFNYHLGKLVDRFVADTDEGYRLTAAGHRVVGAVVSGGFTAQFDGDPVPVEGACSQCGASLEAQFAEQQVEIVCRSCEFVETTPELPGGLVAAWSRENIGTVIARWSARQTVSASLGLCPLCDGPLTRSLALPDEEAAPEWFSGEFVACLVVNDCDRCHYWWHSVLPITAQFHPTVEAYLYDHGIDPRREPWWVHDWFDIDVATVESRDPLRVAVPMDVEGDHRTFVFDREVTLVADRAE